MAEYHSTIIPLNLNGLCLMVPMIYYLFPTFPTDGKAPLNPYIMDFSNALNRAVTVINHGRRTNMALLDLLKNSFSANVYVFNWIENTAQKKFGVIQTIVFLFVILPILKIRRTKVVWVFHNFVSHDAENRLSSLIRRVMSRQSDVILTHSKEAEIYLKGLGIDAKRIHYLCHPMKHYEISCQKACEKVYDILIWGSINPYKGIADFLEFAKENKEEYKIKLVGYTSNIEYSNRITNALTGNVSFENRKVDFGELEDLIASSRFVLFPYLKKSVSSSGALMDTLSFGGSPIGPNKGAFVDMEAEGLCYTYNNYKDIRDIISKKNSVPYEEIEKFIKNNSWDSFVEKLVAITT